MRWTDPRQPRQKPFAATAACALAVALAVGLAGCGPADDPERTGRSEAGPAKVGAAQGRREVQRVLDQRVRAVRQRDLALFLRRVDRDDARLVARQRRYYRNLVQLPLARLRYRVLEDQWEGIPLPARWGTDVRVPQIELIMQLEGYDAVPVRRTVGFAFSFREGRATIVSDRLATGQPLFAGARAPWDLAGITVREEPGVLGIFDRATSASAGTVTAAVRTGIAQVQEALPFTWDGRVVVYSVQSSKVLASFTDVPGGSLDHLGALTFPTYARSLRSEVASTRMLVMPSSVSAGGTFLGRIVRHELSHIAIGSRDDGAPAWVSEGIAEYLGAREIPQRDRKIPTEALRRAQSEEADLPQTETFNDTDQDWHYALSWMACDYIADTFGESRLWELVDAMHDGGDGTSAAEEDQVLQQVLGLDRRELGRLAAERIRNVYG